MDDSIEVMELYFKSLSFQNMAEFYEIKNMEGLKYYHAF